MSEPNFEICWELEDPETRMILEISLADKRYFGQVEPRLAEQERKFNSRANSRDNPKSNPKSNPRANLQRNERCEELYRDGILNSIRVDDIFEDTEEKRTALRKIMGYRSLRGARSLGLARPEIIGRVYQRAFYLGSPENK